MAKSSVILDWGRFGNVYLVPCPLFPLVQSGLPSHLTCCSSLYTGSTSVQIHPHPPAWVVAEIQMQQCQLPFSNASLVFCVIQSKIQLIAMTCKGLSHLSWPLSFATSSAHPPFLLVSPTGLLFNSAQESFPSSWPSYILFPILVQHPLFTTHYKTGSFSSLGPFSLTTWLFFLIASYYFHA